MYTVGELSRLTGVTVRALHHYDEIGLVRPSQRSSAGYRLYGDADVLRLQQVLLFRELGFPLEAIAEAIASADPVTLLRQHRDALVDKRARLDAMLAALDAAITTHERGTAMNPDDFKTMFDGFDPAQYEDEAKQRWGSTEAYQESARRTKQYSKADWQAIKDESGAIYAGLAEHMKRATPVTDAAVQDLVEQHRMHMERWFYPCSKAMQRGLGEMYVADPRFTANLDKWYGDGFAAYLRDAICIA